LAGRDNNVNKRDLL